MNAPYKNPFDEAWSYREQLMGHALKQCNGNRAYAEDIMQDTYFKAYKRLHTFRPGTNLGAWLFAILRTCEVDFFRSRGKEGSTKNPRQNDRIDPDSYFAADKCSDDSEGMAQRAREALAVMPLIYRRAIQLVIIEDMTYAQAAALCGIPAGTMKSRIFRAKELLRAGVDGSA